MNTDQIVAEAWQMHYTSEIDTINNNGAVVPATPCP
jgi:hypothetical protein